MIKICLVKCAWLLLILIAAKAEFDVEVCRFVVMAYAALQSACITLRFGRRN